MENKVTEVMNAYKTYAPTFWNNKDYRLRAIEEIYNNEQLHNDWLGFVLFARRMGLTPFEIGDTLMHDIAGLINKDECFLPRVTGYSEHYLTTIKNK